VNQFREVVLTSRWGRRAKEPVRRVLHRLGYELVPTKMAEHLFIRDLIARHRVDLLLDVGANEGQFALGMRRLGFEGEILSFEPMGEAFAALHRHVDADPKWQAHRLALGAKPADALLHVSANSVSSSLLSLEDLHVRAEPASREQRQETVRVSTLDIELDAQHPQARIWLKIDVQGYETAVLSGATNVLARCEVVQCELSFRPLYADQSDYLDVLDQLRASGFTPVEFIPGFTDPVTGELLQADVVAARLDGAATRINSVAGDHRRPRRK